MIAKLFGGMITLGVYLAAATFIAQVILAVQISIAWKIDKTRIAQMIAIARGVDLVGTPESDTTERSSAIVQASYQALLDRRAEHSRDLEMRELELRNGMDQLAYLQITLAKDQGKFKQVTDAFNARLLALEEGIEAEGRLRTSQILETSMKADQAKEILLDMLDNDEINEVVLLLRDMSDSPRKKIMAELNDVTGNEKLAEVLRLIRLGEPEASIIQAAR